VKTEASEQNRSKPSANLIRCKIYLLVECCRTISFHRMRKHCTTRAICDIKFTQKISRQFQYKVGIYSPL